MVMVSVRLGVARRLMEFGGLGLCRENLMVGKIVRVGVEIKGI
jgi:hypothetical protein